MLLVLGFDVYKQSAEATIAKVKAQGYDLSKVHEDVWQGEPVYIVGAEKGDLRSKQFWIEKKRLLFVRMLEPGRDEKMRDTRFVDYREVPGGWVAAGVEFCVDDKKVFGEEYTDIKTNVKLDPAIFDVKQFRPKDAAK